MFDQASQLSHMLSTVLSAYGLSEAQCVVKPFGSGLINHTWRIECGDRNYILQRINDKVFTQPLQIAENIALLGDHLSQHHSDYLFVQPLPTCNGETSVHTVDGWFRMAPFVEHSHTIDVVSSPAQAWEAAKAFGKFTRLLQGFEAATLSITLPHFHNLSLRYHQFCTALEDASPERKEKAAWVIHYLQNEQGILQTYQAILHNPAFKQRVTHHDTKVSNVLFDENDHSLCVIDLDTVMPGYFISDVGDMLRTYLSPVSEEESDTNKISIRDDYFAAIAEGYLSEMGNELTADETAHFVYAGKFMIYMQALRFATDYLNNDVYYGQRYEGHNLVRATNQATLLQELSKKENAFQALIKDTYLPKTVAV